MADAYDRNDAGLPPMGSDRHAVVVHRPGPGGLFDTTALCGATAGDGVLTLHAYEYSCSKCAHLSGEVGG